MRKSIRIPAALALTLALAVPALAQSTTPGNTTAPANATVQAGTAQKAAPTVDPNKAYLLHQEFIAKTAELRGKIAAKSAELETQLATKPDDTAAITKLTTEIGTLRAQLLVQTTQFRIRYAKETGTPIRMTRGMSHMDGMMGDGMMMDGKMMNGMMGGKMMDGSDCKMMGKDMMGKGMMMMKGMDHDMKNMDHGAKGMQNMQGMQGMNHDMKNMDHGATGTMPGMNMPATDGAGQTAPAATAPASAS